MLYIKVADLQMAITHQYGYLPSLCKDFLTEKATPDLMLEITSADIERESQRAEDTYPPAYIEGLVCYRKIADWLSEKDGCLLHGVLMEMDGRGILVCAHSGVGKSTHARMWQQAFGADKCQIVNGDKPLIRKIDGQIYGYGTPWCGKEGIYQNRKVKITDILMIQRGETNQATPLAKEDALGLLMHQLYVPEHSIAARMGVLDLASDLLSSTRIYQVTCTPTEEAAKVAFAALA